MKKKMKKLICCVVLLGIVGFTMFAQELLSFSYKGSRSESEFIEFSNRMFADEISGQYYSKNIPEKILKIISYEVLNYPRVYVGDVFSATLDDAYRSYIVWLQITDAKSRTFGYFALVRNWQ